MNEEVFVKITQSSVSDLCRNWYKSTGCESKAIEEWIKENKVAVGLTDDQLTYLNRRIKENCGKKWFDIIDWYKTQTFELKKEQEIQLGVKSIPQFTSNQDITFSYSNGEYLDISRTTGDYDLDFEYTIHISELDELIKTLQEISIASKQQQKQYIQNKMKELQVKLDALEGD